MLLQLTRGDTGVFTLPLVDGSGQPLDLGAVDITFTAKRHLLDTVPFIRKTLDDGIDLAGASGDSGICTVTLEPEDTEALTHTERFLWDVQVDSGLDISTPLKGRLVVSMDVTTPGGSGS
jgi:hypothetical protein